MVSPDDTQPRSPFKTPPHGQPPVLLDPPAEDDTYSGGPGCLVWGLIGVVMAGFAVVIIGLAALAGWTSGQRTAQMNATATRSADIAEQIRRFPADAASGNQVLLQARLDYLAALTPGVPEVFGFVQTATAVYLANQPTPTATPTASPPPTVTPPATTAPAPATLSSAGSSSLDLAGLLEQARQSVSLNDWDAAIETLDVILAADSAYEAAAVRSLMRQALSSKALGLFRSGSVGDLAQASILADRAEQFGDIGELKYERYIASLYLDALNTIGTNYPAAIAALREIYSQSPNYRDVTQLLFDQYAAYGDAWAAQSEFCPAAAQYQAALGVLSSGAVNAKLTNAQTVCAQATPTPGPDTTLTPGAPQTIAPVGQTGG